MLNEYKLDDYRIQNSCQQILIVSGTSNYTLNHMVEYKNECNLLTAIHS